MNELLLDLVLPETDRGVAIQWLVMMPVWLAAVVLVRRQPREVKQFVWGLVMLNLGWFAARSIH